LATDIGETDSGGQNIFVRGQALSLAAAGHQVTVFTRRTSATQPSSVRAAPDVRVVHVAAGPAAVLPKEELAPFMGDFGAQLALHWQESPPDIVHAHYWMSGIAALAGARRTLIPVVATFHGLGLERLRHGDPSYLHQRERERVESEFAVAHIADAVVALTADEVTYHREVIGVPPSKIHVIPVGIDAARFSPDGPALERTSRPRIVVAGRLVPRKGIGSAIEALAAVPEAELVIAGGPEPPLLDRDPLVTALRKRAEELGVLDRVIFLGRIPHAEMPALLRSADVFVSTPHYEPFGTVVLEAAACGVPVVATAVGGLPSHVLDGVTGVLIPRGDPVALSTALSELLTHPSRRAALGTAAALRAQRYSWPRVAAELLEVYHSLIG
jgi:glycosyltransferase involved in cell wall biosynthesis